MSREKKTRTANGRSSIYLSEHDNSWHGYVTVGVKNNGKPDRRHVRGKTKAAVTAKVRELEQQRDNGKVRKPGQSWIVEQWLNHCLRPSSPHRSSQKTHLLPTRSPCGYISFLALAHTN
jgi:integrase